MGIPTSAPLRALLLLIAPALLPVQGCDCGPGGGGGNGGPDPIDTTVTCEEDPPSSADAGILHRNEVPLLLEQAGVVLLPVFMGQRPAPLGTIQAKHLARFRR